jgi:hypothetical protein
VAVEVYVEEQLQQSLSQNELTNLSENFKLYKENKAGELLGVQLGNEHFGKDEGLTQPPEVRDILNKVHIKPNNPKEKIKVWMAKINRGLTPASDHILVYCSGKANKDAYLLIDIFRPDGHLKMKNLEHLKELKINFADPFREEF